MFLICGNHYIVNSHDVSFCALQLVVNCVMATDICDKQLKDLRNKRWERAFAGDTASQLDLLAEQDPANAEEDINRKATIVIEHLLQASDVSHTMQHWHVFRKWNENLFMEMYVAYRQGRAEKDPSLFWAKGEIGFFDFYVIPLAKKLKECGVFGVSSDEYLNYAESNRNEWAVRGEEVVAELSEKAKAFYKSKYGGDDKVSDDGKAPLASIEAPLPASKASRRSSLGAAKEAPEPEPSFKDEIITNEIDV